VKTLGAGFPGQEYLGLYPYVEYIPFLTQPHGLGIYVSDTAATPIEAFVFSGVYSDRG
jgi:hypothetical protein